MVDERGLNDYSKLFHAVIQRILKGKFVEMVCIRFSAISSLGMTLEFCCRRINFSPGST